VAEGSQTHKAYHVKVPHFAAKHMPQHLEYPFLQAELQEAQDTVKALKQELARKHAGLTTAQAQLAKLRESEHGPLAMQAEREARSAVEARLAATKSALAAKAHLVCELRDKVKSSLFLCVWENGRWGGVIIAAEVCLHSGMVLSCIAMRM